MKTRTPSARPIPVARMSCRRCGGRAIIFIPATRRVKCVQCTAARAVARMLRTAR